MTRVKICGCMRVDDALAAKEAGADFVGLVFAPGSRRRLDLETARAIVDALGGPLMPEERPSLDGDAPGDALEWFRRGAQSLERMIDAPSAEGRPLAVGVFEDQPIDEVNRIADTCGLDLVQLSGSESWRDCLLASRPVIKALEIAPGAGAENVLAGLEAGAIACLLDASRGRGVAVDRAVAVSVAARLPVWLAGGLTPENVSDAVREVRPWAVDVSSGVETDGAKDAAKVRAFVGAAKMAGSAVTERRT